MEIEEVKTNAMEEEKDHLLSDEQSGKWLIIFYKKYNFLPIRKQLLLWEENASAHQSATRQSNQSGQGIKLIIQ